MKYELERQDVDAAPAPDMRARGRRVQEPTPPMSGGARVQEGVLRGKVSSECGNW